MTVPIRSVLQSTNSLITPTKFRINRYNNGKLSLPQNLLCAIFSAIAFSGSLSIICFFFFFFFFFLAVIVSFFDI